MKPTIKQLASLIGNPAAYAVQKDDGSWYPVSVKGDPEAQWKIVLIDHLTGRTTVGTYVNKGDQARTLVFDVDEVIKGAGQAHRIGNALVDLGFEAKNLGVEFSGRKGYHLWVVFGGYVPAKDLRRIGRAALAVAEVDCEVFPKQDSVRELGNLVKLPGGVHRVSGKANDFVTPFPVLVGKTMFEAVVNSLPEEKKVLGGGGGRPDPFPCLAKIQDGVSEGGRNNAAFHLAVMLRRSGLADRALGAVMEAVNAEFDPPLGYQEIERIIASSANSGPICGQLPKDLHCGDLCLLNREGGLKTRPGQLRYAGEGETVVLRVGQRKDKVVELMHEDIAQAKAALKYKGRD